MLAIFSDQYRPKIDGVSISLERLSSALTEQGIAHDLFVPEQPGEYRDKPNTFRFRSVPWFFQPEYRFALPVEPRHLKQAFSQPYTIVHAHTPGPLGLTAFNVAKLRGLPYFTTFHTNLPHMANYLFEGQILTPQMIEQICTWWVNITDFLIVPSSKIYNWFRSLGIKIDMRIIPNGIDLHPFAKASGGDNYLRNAGFISDGDFVCLYVGRLGPEKSIDTLIKYFESAVHGLPKNVKLVIVGQGNEENHLRNLADKLGIANQVVFTRYIESSQIAEVYASADVLTFLSQAETQGVVVAEAMATGLPLILAPDVAYDDCLVEGENGFYVNNAAEFTRSLKTLVDNPEIKSRFGNKSRLKSQQFDISITTRKLIDYYNYGTAVFERKNKDTNLLNIFTKPI